MKKRLLILSAVLFVALVSLSVLAFTDDDPKKQKQETTTGACEQPQHAGTAAEAKGEGACCKKEGAACKEGGECQHHGEAKAEVK
jgi:hypothetical protein